MANISDPFYQHIFYILISLICGFLIGLPQLKREKRHGARDHMFLSMLSTLGVIFYDIVSDSTFALIIMLLMEISVIIYILSTTFFRMFKEDYPGYTTTLALFMSWAMGIMVFFSYETAIVGSALFLIILSTKKQFYKIQKLSSVEWNSTIEYIALVVVFLILIPKDTMIGDISLISIVYIFVMILSLKYVSYFFLKLSPSENSIYYVSLLGGFAHSEAMTRELAKMDAHPSSIMLVLQTMLMRILFIIFIAREIFDILIIPLLATALFGILFARHYLRKHTTEVKIDAIKNPISIKSALIFSATYFAAVLMTVILEYITNRTVLPNSIYYVVAFVIGALSGGSASLFATTAYLNGLVPTNVAVVMIIIGLGACIFNKIIYTWVSQKEHKRGFYIRLITYQLITYGLLVIISILVANSPLPSMIS